jgi:hypothetical protein
MPALSREIIEAAILGFEQQKRNIDVRIAELREMLDGSPTKTKTATTPAASKEAAPRKRTMSAAGRKAIAAAQRKRWAASHGESDGASVKVTRKAKRKLSAAGRAAIVAALKKRWAAKKKAA